MTKDQAFTTAPVGLKGNAKILPVAPLISSQQTGWNNIFLAYYRQPACEIPKHLFTQHTLTICDDLGTPSEIECRLDGQFKRFWFNSGDIIFCPASKLMRI